MRETGLSKVGAYVSSLRLAHCHPEPCPEPAEGSAKDLLFQAQRAILRQAQDDNDDIGWTSATFEQPCARDSTTDLAADQREQGVDVDITTPPAHPVRPRGRAAVEKS